MDDRVLAEGPGRIALEGAGDCAVLSIKDGADVRFAVETATLAAVLDDVPIQLSSPEGYCRIEAFGDRVRLDFVLTGSSRGSCLLAASDFAAALAWVRAKEVQINLTSGL